MAWWWDISMHVRVLVLGREAQPKLLRGLMSSCTCLFVPQPAPVMLFF